MFTNWLTGTSGGGSANNGQNVLPGSSTSVAAVAAAAAAVGSVTNGIMSTPPDVVLEVGPTPGSVRFVAHSIVLGMHSGYLRSAIRLDENAAAAAAAIIGGGVATNNGGTGTELVLYLNNVTAEQFGPLLTYMYTGYLELNVENIFGVLLATHVLHMPRALEICRSYLARTQADGYLASNAGSAGIISASNPNSSGGKIIRPIPSKAPLPSYGFLPLSSTPHHLPPPTDTYKQLAAVQNAYATPTHVAMRAPTPQRIVEIDVDDEDAERHSAVASQRQANVNAEADDEDVEVFIDSNTETDIDADMDVDADAISVTSRASTKNKQLNVRRSSSSAEREIIVTVTEPAAAPATPSASIKRDRNKDTANAASMTRAQQRNANAPCSKGPERNGQHKRDKPRKASRQKASDRGSATNGLQIAKAPIPASQLATDNAEASKVIIDVASCDGPVRFRRILNTAYGHKPEDYAVVPERTQQALSLSFHQQMAKTISQQRQLANANEESENSESSGGGGGGGSGSHAHGKHGKAAGTHDIYVCVYCKHTFKSQYCYQKHAKRHLNPLGLNCAAASLSGVETPADLAAHEQQRAATGKVNSVGTTYGRPNNILPLPMVVASSKQTATELLRREVRPLDMNVQYYPCKTCGSKFPSYYFVHKHRKLCHADEEAAAAAEQSSKRDQGGGDVAAADGTVRGNGGTAEATQTPKDGKEAD